jgi:sec-independent protein translocase protein TatB
VFGIGPTEFVAIAIVLLIVVGPRQLPEMLHRGGRMLAQLRMAGREMQIQIEQEIKDLQDTGDNIRKEWSDSSAPLRDMEIVARDVVQELQAPVRSTKEALVAETVTEKAPEDAVMTDLSADTATEADTGE